MQRIKEAIVWSCSSTLFQIWHRPMPAISAKAPFGFELRDGGRIRGVAVGVDHPRRGMVRSAQRFGEKALSRGRVLLPDGDMVNPQTTLGEQLLDLAVGK
jgi:hypothetical protein